MDTSKWSYEAQQALKDTQAILRDYREGKIPVDPGTPEHKILGLVETIMLTIQVMPEDDHA